MADCEIKQNTIKSLISKGFSKRYVLIFALLILYITFTAFTTESLSIFNGKVSDMNDLEFYLSAASSLLFGGAILYMAFTSFGAKLNRPLFVICSILLVIDIVAVLTFPKTIGNQGVVYSIKDSERARYIINWLVADVCIYIFIGIVPYIFKSHTAVDFWLWVGIGVGLLLIFASFFKDKDSWKLMLSGKQINGLLSLTNHKNTFGFVLVWGFSCSLILYAKYHRPPYVFLCVLFALMSFAVSSKSTIATLGIETALTIILFPIVCWKKRKKGQIIFLSIMGFWTIFLILVAFAPIAPLRGFSDFLKAEVKNLFTFSGGNMTGRTVIWKGIFDGFKNNPTIMLFGAGDGVFEYFVGTCAPEYVYLNYKLAAHNGFLYVWGRFGLVGLLVYLVGLAYIIYDTIHAIKVRKDVWLFVIFIVLFGFLCHSMAEDDALLDMRLKGMMFLGIIWWPLSISRRDWNRKKSQSLLTEEPKIINVTKHSSLDILKTSYLVSTILFVVLVGLAPLFETAFGTCSFNNKYSLAGLTVLFLAGPLLLLVGKKLRDANEKTRYFFHTVLTLAFFVWGFVVGMIADSLMYPLVLIGVFLLALISGGMGLKFEKPALKEMYPLLIKIFIGVIVVGLSHCLNAYLPSEITKTCLVILLCLYVSIDVLAFSLLSKVKTYNGSIDVIGLNIESLYENKFDEIDTKANERINSTY